MTFAQGLQHVLGGMGGVIKELLVQQLLAPRRPYRLSANGPWASSSKQDSPLWP